MFHLIDVLQGKQSCFGLEPADSLGDGPFGNDFEQTDLTGRTQMTAPAKLLGIITDADLRRLMTQHGKKAFGFKAGDIMTANCKRIRADALASEATALFHKYRIDELPVVDSDDRPVGLIDVQDIVTIKVVG